jgi:hypothetical protein
MALLARAMAWRATEIAPISADRYRGIPLGVESAWPAPARVEE